MHWARYGVGTAVALALLSPAIFLAGGVVALAVVFGAVAVVVLLVTFAPALPKLNELPRIGAPQISVSFSLDGRPDMSVIRVGWIDECVLRVGFINTGPIRIDDVTVNTLVESPVVIQACDHDGTLEERGKAMPGTVEEGRLMNFWAEREGPLPVRATLLHYLLSFPDAGALGDRFLVRVRYTADGLYGRGDRIDDCWVRVLDPSTSGGDREGVGESRAETDEDGEVDVERDAGDALDAEGRLGNE